MKLKILVISIGLGAFSLHAQYGKPNIILMMADDMGWGDLHYNGNSTVITPNLDSMAAEGLNFRRFHSQSAVCSPTRGSVMTGRHPERLGINTANDGHLPSDELTIAEVLKTQGYRTAHFGKWHMGTLDTTLEKDGRRGGDRTGSRENYSPPWMNGFDVCFSTEVQMPSWDPMVNQDFPAKYWTGPGVYAKDTLTGDDSRIIMDRVIPFITKAKNDNVPFLAVVWFHAPHQPYRAGPDFKAMYPSLSLDEKNYWGAITALDVQVGRLRHELKSLGLDNTFLAFTSDNGPLKASPGLTGGMKGFKHEYYEGGIRVPGLLEWPAVIKSPMVSDYIAVSSDYYPTILNILNLEIVTGQPLPVDGTSFLPAILGQATVRPKPITLFVNAGGDVFSGVISGDKKLVKEGAGAWQFYDLTQDKNEATDLVNDPKYKSLVDSLKNIVTPLLGSLSQAAPGDYPHDPLVVVNHNDASFLRSGARPALSAPAFDGVYNIQGRNLESMQKASGGVLVRKGGRTYLVRQKK